MKTFTRTLALVATVALTASSCTLDNPKEPMLTGPSTYFLSVAITASPDILPEDGASQSVIRIVARDANGQPVPNLPVRIDTVSGGQIVEFGVLSSRTVTTNASGEAAVVFTAPRAAIPGFDAGTIVEIRATPIGTDYAGVNPRSVLIRLVPESTATIPGAPTPSFTFTPSSPKAGDLITYNASGSRDDDGAIVRYRWAFSDGHTEEGAVVAHDFVTAGSYFVTLTVTDNEGKSASVTRSVIVTGS